MNNLGLLPLAGLCGYEEACKIGYDIEHNVNLLKRYNYAESQLNKIFAAHIPSVPEWEAKCAMSLHLWLDAEHSAALRKRVGEMREPPLHLDKVPDPGLQAFFNELIRSETTLELLVGIYGVAKRELIRSLRKHLAETNPLADQPTCRLLRIALGEEQEMVEWGEHAVRALIRTEADRAAAERWQRHLETFLSTAGGIFGDLSPPLDGETANPRSDGLPYAMKVEVRRDGRFRDNYNSSAKIDQIYADPGRPADERTYALLYKRLREMDVPEWVAPIIYATSGKPWEYYQDLSRQLWDEARHAMMGEVGLYRDGVAFYAYPVDAASGMALNTSFTPYEAHVILWYIEQNLMPKATGKRYEWEIAKASDNPLAMMFQDYDWADEVLHAQIGRKWLVPGFSSMEALQQAGEALMSRIGEAKGKLYEQSTQTQWWPDFLEAMRKGKANRLAP